MLLPSDKIVKRILSRLPVKFLLRFRCVSKSWRCIIDSQEFIRMHLLQSAKTHTNHSFLIEEHKRGMYTMDLGSVDKAIPVDAPFLHEDFVSVTNTCNGLVLVVRRSPPLLLLWNPFTRKYKDLPCPQFEIPLDHLSRFFGYYWLGYDSKNDDYKVLRNDEFMNKESGQWVCCRTQVYSLKSNSWKWVEEFPYSLLHKNGIWTGYVNGAIHVLMNKKLMIKYYRKYFDKSNRIVAYSFENENHFDLMLPQNMPSENVVMCMTVLGGCLSLCCNTKSNVSIWVMKEYGVQESWIKLMSFDASEFHCPCDIFRPCGYSRHGQKVLLFSSKTSFIWYDLRRKDIEHLDVYGLPSEFVLEPCIESLVSPVRLDGQQRKNKKKRDDFLSKGFNLVL